MFVLVPGIFKNAITPYAEIYIFMKTAESDFYGGMTITTTEPKELAVVNIVGPGNVKEITRQADQTKFT